MSNQFYFNNLRIALCHIAKCDDKPLTTLTGEYLTFQHNLERYPCMVYVFQKIKNKLYFCVKKTFALQISKPKY